MTRNRNLVHLVVVCQDCGREQESIYGAESGQAPCKFCGSDNLKLAD